MMNPYVIIGMLLFWIGSVLGSYSYGHHQGTVGEDVKWEVRATAEAQQAAVQIKAAEDSARQQEQAANQRQAAISSSYEEKLQNAEQTHQADLAAIRAGALRLRDPASPVQACPAPGAPASPSTGGRDGAAAGYLSTEAADFLLSLADDADRTAQQLAACQAIVTADRQ